MVLNYMSRLYTARMVYVMGFLKKMFGGGPVSDEPLSDQLNDLQWWYEADPELRIEAECDVIPGGYGPFGRCFTNPIPVNGVTGEVVYLNRLRSKSGAMFLFHRLGSYSSDVCGQKVDLYELVAEDGSEWINLVFNMYHPRRSTKPPEGITLMPWDSFTAVQSVTLKLCCHGSSFFVNDFPRGLPDVIEKDQRLNSLFAGGLGTRMADQVREKMRSHTGKWNNKKWENPFLEASDGLISISERDQLETRNTSVYSTVSEAAAVSGEILAKNREQVMHATLPDQIGKHLQFFGYEIADQEAGFIANHISKPRFRVFPYLDGLLFSCTFTTGENAAANQLAYLNLLNGGNREATVSRFYAGGDNSLVHECYLSGEYDRVQFARFFEMWERDYQQLRQLPEAAIIFS